MSPIDEIKEVIADNQISGRKFRNFVLQGGAGSGKTETLKEIIEFISVNFPDKKIACITHTNIAVDEIRARVGETYQISTIHSFLNSVIKDYKKNIKEVISVLFSIKIVEELKHEDYKKAYQKYSNQLYSLKNQVTPKVTGKRDYDKNQSEFNESLNAQIEILNKEIEQIVAIKDYSVIRYNETRFDSFEDLSFGHDGLIEVAYLLFNKFELLGKIISDKYDFLFIDEYQDTNERIIDIVLNKILSNNKTTVGLFGDSMQGIYDDGIGDVEDHIEKGKLIKIEKKDNYRCSMEVIDFINLIRIDEIEQEVALKINNGEEEKIEKRKGKVKLFYSIYGKKPSMFSPVDEKDSYLRALNNLIKTAEGGEGVIFKKLMLTNKSISSELGFPFLYKIYSDRYSEVKEEIEKDLIRLQLFDLLELCNAYIGENKNYNFILKELKKSGFVLNTAKDKAEIQDIFEFIINSNASAIKILEYAFEKKIIKKSEKYNAFVTRRNLWLEQLEIDVDYKKLESLYLEGANTAIRMTAQGTIISEEEFNEFDRNRKRKNYFNELFSDSLEFKEVLNYFNYINEKTEYITMHKTKGSGIENVLVVLDEYFWTKYNFLSIFDEDETDLSKKIKNQKLFYVACSRAIRNLTCVRLVADENEEKKLLNYFKKCEIIKV